MWSASEGDGNWLKIFTVLVCLKKKKTDEEKSVKET